MKLLKHEYWVTNIARDRDVSLGDLRITIRKGQTVNLLDKRHYSFTHEQLEASRTIGSISKKAQWIKVRDLPPRYPVAPGLYASKTLRYAPPLRSPVEVEYKQYEELGDALQARMSSEEKFAAEEADTVFDDQAPALAVDEHYDPKPPPKPTRPAKAAPDDDKDIDSE